MPSPYNVVQHCAEDCRSPVDSGCPIGPGCKEGCIGGLRTAAACACTCNQTFVHGDDPPSTGALAENITGFKYCTCLNADDKRSIDPTTITKGVLFGWDMSGIPTGQHPLALSAKGCPDNPGFSFSFFQSRPTTGSMGPSTNLVCPLTSSDWDTVVEVPGGPLVIINPSDTDTHEHLYPVTPVGDEDPDRADCDAGRLPHLFALEIRDLCGNLMSLCILPWSPEESVTCPLCEPGPCCTVSVDPDIGLTNATACDDDGNTIVTLTLDILCPSGCNPSRTGGGTVQLGSSDLHTFTATADDILTFTDTMPCNDTGQINYTIVFDWDDVTGNCPPSVNCGDTFFCPSDYRISGTIAIGGGLLT